MRQGFTLMELLLTLTILGIILGIASLSMLSLWYARQLQEGAAQLASDVERVRSGAIRYNTTATFEQLSSSSYQLTINGVSSVTQLPYALKLTNTPAKLTYSAPYSELTSSPVTLVLHHPRSNRDARLRTVGVTGKVIRDGS